MANETFDRRSLDQPSLPESERTPDLGASVFADALSRFAGLVSPDEVRSMLPEEASGEPEALARAAAILHIDAALAGVPGEYGDLAA